MTEKRVSIRYARAVFQTALQANLAEVVYHDFLMIDGIFDESRELRSMSASPVFQNWRKKKIYQEVFGDGKVSKITLDFLILLIDKRRAALIPSIIVQYIYLYNIQNNRLPVEIMSARELPENVKQRVVNKLADLTKKTILPTYKIDASLKGGLSVKIDDWVYDASIKNQLANLYRELCEGGLV